MQYHGINAVLGLVGLLFGSLLYGQTAPAKSMLPGDPASWTLVWSDEFAGTEADLDAQWSSQNGPSGHILCSRWRENAKVGGGTLKLLNRKESRGGQPWTSGSLWTKQQFKYGYFECRYKYAAAPATNNSFWLMTQGPAPAQGKSFEIDINEGHYPNQVNTNIHNWSDVSLVNGKKPHPVSSQSFLFGLRPDCTIQLETPITTRRIRFSSQHQTDFQVEEFRVYNVNPAGYPDPFSAKADAARPGLVNFARDPATRISVSGCYRPGAAKELRNLVDGKLESSWITQKTGEKWLELEFSEAKTVGCVQFLAGRKNKDTWVDLISDYKVQYHDGQKWVDLLVFDVTAGNMNFARDFHVYGLEWNEQELVFYLDGNEIRREKNTFCLSPAPVWLSLAIISWAGPVTDAIDGTVMEVDYVRIYQRK